MSGRVPTRGTPISRSPISRSPISRLPARLLLHAPAAALLLVGWAFGTGPAPGLAPALVAAAVLAVALAGTLTLHLARPGVATVRLRAQLGGRSGFCADDGPPRQCDPDAPGRSRPRAPGRRPAR